MRKRFGITAIATGALLVSCLFPTSTRAASPPPPDPTISFALQHPSTDKVSPNYPTGGWTCVTSTHAGTYSHPPYAAPGIWGQGSNSCNVFLEHVDMTVDIYYWQGGSPPAGSWAHIAQMGPGCSPTGISSNATVWCPSSNSYQYGNTIQGVLYQVRTHVCAYAVDGSRGCGDSSQDVQL